MKKDLTKYADGAVPHQSPTGMHLPFFRLLSCVRVSRGWRIKCLLVLQEALKRVRLVS